MIFVEHVNIILEEDKYILYLQTTEGVYYRNIATCFAEYMSKILNNQKTFCGRLLKDMSFKSCILEKDHNAILESSQKSDSGTWEEVLPIAIEIGVPIFLHPDLLMVDYVPNEEHQKFVNDLIVQEQLYDQSVKVKQMTQSLTQAIADQRFEDAAVLRDKIDSFSKK